MQQIRAIVFCVSNGAVPPLSRVPATVLNEVFSTGGAPFSIYFAVNCTFILIGLMSCALVLCPINFSISRIAAQCSLREGLSKTKNGV